MKKRNVGLLLTLLFFVLFIVFTFAVMKIDVAPTGLFDSKIGFSDLNKAVFDTLGENPFWYTVSEVCGVIALMCAGIFALCGMYQLITRKSFKKVDKHIYLLAAFYILVIATYIFFEIFVVNYRPVFIENQLEASYPSSHTMLTLCIMSTAIIEIGRMIKNIKYARVLQVASIVIMSVTVIGRLLSGVHWFTDIIGGVLISLALVSLYSYFCNIIKD